MTCVAVTRGGWGDIYAFDSTDEANRHPLVQYGDAVVSGPQSLLQQYNLLEIGRLLTKLDDERLRISVLRSIHPDLGLKHSDRVKKLSERSSEIWDLLVMRAVRPPSDPETIIAKVQRDRELLNKESTMPENKEAQDTTKKDKAEKAPKVAKEPKPPRYNEGDVIRLLSDAEGKQYGAANNPKRAASASAIRFANYVDGMTVAELLAKGDTQSKVFADLDYDQAKGYIEIESAS